MHRKFIVAGIALGAIMAIGTIGYWLIGGREYAFLDSLCMTVITISTIGYNEIIRLSGNPIGRLFAIFIALSGIGILFYIITNLTAFVVEGEPKDSFRRRKMEKLARNYRDHYIVCGIGMVGAHIIHELHATGRPHIIVDISRDNPEKHAGTIPADVFIEDDATDDNTLLKAGADAVVSPSLIGGLRMASEMIRPTVVSFLDIMLRDKEKNLLIEEIPVPPSFAGKSLSALDLTKHSSLLLLAVRIKDDFIYDPSDDYVIQMDNTLIFMGSPEERRKLEKSLNLHG